MGKYIIRAECGSPGCAEIAHYEADTRKDQRRLYEKYGNKQWRCIRHSRPDEMLGLENRRIVWESVSQEKFYEGSSIGLYWDSSGFLSGPGFRAFTKDFPEGTILRIMAEIVLPPSQ